MMLLAYSSGSGQIILERFVVTMGTSTKKSSISLTISGVFLRSHKALEAL
jgi:hypothetical protein